MTETYESIQTEAKGPGVDEWRQVDRARSELTALYRGLAEDDTRTEEYKTERCGRRKTELPTTGKGAQHDG